MRAALVPLGAWLLAFSAAAFGQEETLRDANIQKRANTLLTVMGYSLTPDVTTGSLSIRDSPTSNPNLRIVSVGGGDIWSKELPLYGEGTLSFSLYDPTFVSSNGTEERKIPTHWNSASGTGGVGWDFFITPDLRWRPIFNFSVGHVDSDASGAGRPDSNPGVELAFLQRGRLNAYGLGGSIMLDYERYRPESEVDLELRYTNIHLRSTSDTSAAAQGSANSVSASAWARYRAPTGFTMLERPVRYVLEAAHTAFLGDLRGVMGFSDLTSLGVGLELDSSKYDMFITRTRAVVRYVFGKNVSGASLGLAVSF